MGWENSHSKKIRSKQTISCPSSVKQFVIIWNFRIKYYFAKVHHMSHKIDLNKNAKRDANRSSNDSGGAVKAKTLCSFIVKRSSTQTDGCNHIQPTKHSERGNKKKKPMKYYIFHGENSIAALFN